MEYQLLSEQDTPLDAHFAVEGDQIVFHSRGGSRGSPSQRNADYSAGLRTLLDRLRELGVGIQNAWVDSGPTQRLRLDERVIFSEADASRSPEEAVRLMSSRMKDVGRRKGAKPSGGNSTKRIRISLSRHLTKDDIRQSLRAIPSKENFRSGERLPAEDLRSVQANHVWDSVRSLLTDHPPPHAFGESTDYDLIVDGDRRLSPKAVFGLAASEALGFEVLPKHFTGGIGTPCFEVLKAAGFEIVRKGEKPDEPEQVPEDLSWTEGSRRLVAHLKSERARGLSQAKKAAFRAEHGRLFCERCDLDPDEAYGVDHGAACIEVHHATIHVADMGPSRLQARGPSVSLRELSQGRSQRTKGRRCMKGLLVQGSS